jgi:hypothetical protein
MNIYIGMILMKAEELGEKLVPVPLVYHKTHMD